MAQVVGDLFQAGGNVADLFGPLPAMDAFGQVPAQGLGVLARAVPRCNSYQR